MGFKISWIGFHGVSKEAILAKFGFVDTGIVDEANEAPFSGSKFPGGWFIVFCNDFDFVSPQRLAALSADCRVVACQVHEGIMMSAAYGYEQGKPVWSLVHNSDRGAHDLSVCGSPPPVFETTRQRLAREQETNVADGVDYIFDIPVETAAALCSYRHDRWGEPWFTRLATR